MTVERPPRSDWGVRLQRFAIRADQLPGGPKVQEFANAAAERLSTTADYMRSHDAKRMLSDVERVVKNNPGPSLVIAAAFGFSARPSVSLRLAHSGERCLYGAGFGGCRVPAFQSLKRRSTRDQLTHRARSSLSVRLPTMCFTLLTSNRPARHSQCGVTQIHFHTAMLNALSQDVFAGSRLALRRSHVEISRRLRARKLLGFGLITALLIYMFIR
jgi:hypothetical protein